MKKDNNNTTKNSIDILKKNLNIVVDYIKFEHRLKTIGSIAKKIDFGRTNLSSALNGSGKYLTEGLVDKFVSAFPELNKDWIMFDKGEMLISEEEEQGAKISYNKNEGRPYYPVDWTLGLQEDIIDDELFYPEFNIDFEPANKESVNWYTASGNSMIGEIDAGSYIAMEEIHDFSWFPLGQIYGIVTTNGMRTIKRVVASDNKDYYLLKSSNPDKENYPDQDIPKKMIKRVFRVLWVIRKLD